MSSNRLSNLRWKTRVTRLGQLLAIWEGSNSSWTSHQPELAVKVMNRSEPLNLCKSARAFWRLCCMKWGPLVKLAGKTTFLPIEVRLTPSWSALTTPLYSSAWSFFLLSHTQIKCECSAAAQRWTRSSWKSWVAWNQWQVSARGGWGCRWNLA